MKPQRSHRLLPLLLAAMACGQGGPEEGARPPATDSAPAAGRAETAAVPAGQPPSDTVEMRGTYSYMADAGRFTDCATGESHPVAQIADNIALERAYLDARPEAGAPVLVTFRGHYEELPGMEGDRLERHVVVDRFGRAWPGLGCEDPMPATPEDTDWSLVLLGELSARAAQGGSAPTLRLDAATRRASGNTGCNQYSGPYALDGESLRFEPLAVTRRACLDEAMNAQETAFLAALEATRRWRIAGDTLILSDQTGEVARFRPRTGG